MHYLDKLRQDVDTQFPHLGDLLIAELLAIKAKKCLLAVSAAGTGKSTATNLIAYNHPHALVMDSWTVNGLLKRKSELENFTGVVICDDAGKIDSSYSRIWTVVSMAELCYGHFYDKSTGNVNDRLDNFHGSAVVNVQPVVLAEVVKIPQWESNVRDKTIRYYHLYRPQKPNNTLPDFAIDWGIELSAVALPIVGLDMVDDLFAEVGYIWSRARALMHYRDLIAAAAAYDKRTKSNKTDRAIVLRMLRSCRLESQVLEKTDFEGERFLNSDLLCLITEFATYGAFTLADLCADYGFSTVQAALVMQRYARYAMISRTKPIKFYPSEELAGMLRLVGAEVSVR